MASMASNPALNEQSFEQGIGASGAVGQAGMTARGTYLKAGFLLVLLILAGGFGWLQVEIIEFQERLIPLAPSWTWGIFLLTFIVGLLGAVAYRAAPIVAILYVLLKGTLLGIAAAFYNLEFEGVVLQAIIVTVCVFAAVLLLYLLGIIRVTSRFIGGILTAMGGLLMLYAVAWLLSLFGVRFAFLYAPTPLGIGLALAIVILAALNLPLDFEFIRQVSAKGAPKFMEWYGAFGLMLSIIWMYVSILRLLALLRAAGDRR